MQYFEISYRRSYYWIDKKYVKTENGATDAICKTRLKNITDCVEITQEQYNDYKRIQKERKDRNALLKNDAFIK